MTAALATLNPAAQVALEDCEQRIERGLRTFIEVGAALAAIRDNKLYRGTHETFEAYCRERWGISDSRARQLVIAAETVTNVTVEGLPAPSNEGQARALAAIPEPERAEVWRDVVESGEKPTAAAIRKAAEARTPEPVDAPSTAPAGSGSASPAPEPETCLGADMNCGRPLPCPDHPRTPEERIAAVAEVAPEFVKPVEPEDETAAAWRRESRFRLLQVVELLAPVGGDPNYLETWARQLGPYDDELAELVDRAHDALSALDDLISEVGK